MHNKVLVYVKYCTGNNAWIKQPIMNYNSRFIREIHANPLTEQSLKHQLATEATLITYQLI